MSKGARNDDLINKGKTTDWVINIGVYSSGEVSHLHKNKIGYDNYDLRVWHL